MTSAHRAVLRQLFDCLARRDDIVIRRGEAAPGEYGDVEFDTDTITVDRRLDFELWVQTMAHELVHLGRGPCEYGDEEFEEQVVAEETAKLLVPPDMLPSILEAAKPAKIAAALEVDESTVRLAIDLTRKERNDAARAAALTDGDEGTA